MKDLSYNLSDKTGIQFSYLSFSTQSSFSLEPDPITKFYPLSTQSWNMSIEQVLTGYNVWLIGALRLVHYCMLNNAKLGRISGISSLIGYRIGPSLYVIFKSLTLCRAVGLITIYSRDSCLLAASREHFYLVSVFLSGKKQSGIRSEWAQF